MLPGFRFVFAAIVLSMSVLIFGLGAAALLRAAHEEFASSPSRRAVPEATFAQPNEATGPALSMLRVEEPPAAEPKPSDNVPAVAEPAEQSEIVSTPAEPESTAALKPEDSSPPETAKPEIPVSETPPQDAAAPALADTPASVGETQTAATGEVAPSANEAAPTAPEQADAPALANTDIASTKIATLGGPPVTIEAQPPAKTASAKPDRSVTKKDLKARRAIQRRKIALRARAAAPQQLADPFAQPASR